MKKTCILALLVVGVSLTGPSAAIAQPDGEWVLNFDTMPQPTELTLNFTNLTLFFAGVSVLPRCSWLGFSLPLGGNSAVAIGFLSCNPQDLEFSGLLFATLRNRTMTGIMFSGVTTPATVSFEGDKS